ncbi:50S ribosomal protein L32 [Candidatus Berkelbacteria bacterium CG_4_10_14_0_8_um_filter_35_9_33_8]|uniref:Large ribosomal subunit protein bL32 n=1 Tax=Candidatus Berkelbacteria bacterium CG_4_10_14_0_2_um_filter_35_9_33_12 TaxID=1974499 RepID=A0A2M7W3L6_9BACT|nr:MAG: 50S ribosomal protein L32 [Candidatus Berkelbacteria bacterium CG23_combo_of_CG06-09_8_20_14_all_33_15]PIS08232.1 MAG: 50S ribosomal protein L32 [Candidatus Berkelbacteria bacterium CG10_big_fil_rev_8_21_14_0_10_33_10]PIZ28449.1 MAG: 50S ribosomal protein L32 [Candidatus Berkelbacteria bacterium CG_4_10_14_0_8_um_filter_35_9_33_8]PJA20125.1 MAG: 50S ribosomal protein L32 [Candidatus Berkelbacteria bacterium CG_4_10_14_0_2_um_filter_35_9_33_12]
MAEPKKKRSNSRSRKAQNNLGWKTPSIARCIECKAVKRPHQVCSNCGKYRKKKIISIK